MVPQVPLPSFVQLSTTTIHSSPLSLLRSQQEPNIPFLALFFPSLVLNERELLRVARVTCCSAENFVELALMVTRDLLCQTVRQADGQTLLMRASVFPDDDDDDHRRTAGGKEAHYEDYGSIHPQPSLHVTTQLHSLNNS